MKRLQDLAPHIAVTFTLTSLLLHLTLADDVTNCRPRACILSQWTDWSACSHSCGQQGITSRYRQQLAAPSCGGNCTGSKFETSECNRKCCPSNCRFTKWAKDKRSCRCDVGTFCVGAFRKEVCFWRREKLSEASCGGFCEDKTFLPVCESPCCLQNCVFGG